jgi:hypothetical protein
MKQHQYHRGISEAAAALGDETKLRGSISDVDRVVRILDGNISTEEERASVSDPSSPAYPILLRIMAARHDNLKETLSALERRLPPPRPVEVASPCGSMLHVMHYRSEVPARCVLQDRVKPATCRRDNRETGHSCTLKNTMAIWLNAGL